MKQVKYLIIAATCLFVCSCDNNDNIAGMVISNGQFFYVLDKDGNDLLDPKYPNALKAQDIKMYYLIDGVKVDAAKFDESVPTEYATSDNNGGGFSIVTPWKNAIQDQDSSNYDSDRVKHYLLVIDLNRIAGKKDGDISYTYIEWKGRDTDTIQSQTIRRESLDLRKVTMVNDSVWSPRSESDIFTLIKK